MASSIVLRTISAHLLYNKCAEIGETIMEEDYQKGTTKEKGGNGT